MPEVKRLLILGGTAEAAELARMASEADAGRIEIVTSLAGRLAPRRDLAGRVRRGGFGGADGLARFLDEESIYWLIDATHPFAEVISAHAETACTQSGVPRLVLARPPWRRVREDDWREVDDMAGAAQLLPSLGKRAFLSVGPGSAPEFSQIEGMWFLVRVIETPPNPLPLPEHELITGRPPFTVYEERLIIARHRIDVVVTKNSGGVTTEAKLAAARAAAIPVVMVNRPPPPPGDRVPTAEAALAWLESRL